jgi:hypothetical protein
VKIRVDNRQFYVEINLLLKVLSNTAFPSNGNMAASLLDNIKLPSCRIWGRISLNNNAFSIQFDKEQLLGVRFLTVELELRSKTKYDCLSFRKC